MTVSFTEHVGIAAGAGTSSELLFIPVFDELGCEAAGLLVVGSSIKGCLRSMGLSDRHAASRSAVFCVADICESGAGEGATFAGGFRLKSLRVGTTTISDVCT